MAKGIERGPAPDPDEETLARLRSAYAAARVALGEHVQAMCPGEHLAVQHRDARPPWCRACRRTDMGHPIMDESSRSDTRRTRG